MIGAFLDSGDDEKNTHLWEARSILWPHRGESPYFPSASSSSWAAGERWACCRAAPTSVRSSLRASFSTQKERCT